LRPVGLCLSHSDIEELPKTLLGRSGRINLIPALKVTQTASGPVGLCLSHSGFKGSPRSILGRSVFVFVILASKSHPYYFWAGRAVSFSFQRRMSPKPLSGRSGKNKKAKKVMAPFGIRTHTFSNAQRFTTLTIQTCDVTPLNVYLK
jgi:hypothetical protein